MTGTIVREAPTGQRRLPRAQDGRARQRAADGRRQRLGRARLALQVRQQQRERGMPLFHRLSEVRRRPRRGVEASHGAVEPGLAVRDVALGLGLEARDLPIGRRGGEQVDQHGRGADAHPQGRARDHAGQGELAPGRQNKRLQLAARADVEVPLGKQSLHGATPISDAVNYHCPVIPTLGTRYAMIKRARARGFAFRAHQLGRLFKPTS